MFVRTHVFGDIHNHLDSVEKFLSHYEPKRVIWLGDFFDNFNDGPFEARCTAVFLRGLMARRDDVFLMSNHDIAYRFPNNESLRCPGYSPEKSRVINEIITPELWNRFVFFHYENGIMHSHSGIDGELMNYWAPIDKIEFLCKIALADARRGVEPTFLTNSRSLIWRRFAGLLPFGDYSQIVGHTPYNHPCIHRKGDLWNLDLDCAHRYFGVHEEDGFHVFDRKNNKYINFDKIKAPPKKKLTGRVNSKGFKSINNSKLLIPESTCFPAIPEENTIYRKI